MEILYKGFRSFVNGKAYATLNFVFQSSVVKKFDLNLA